MELGLNYNKGTVLLKDVAKRQEISLKYLDHIFSALKSSGLIKSSGRGKGYILSKPPSKITIYNIVEAFEDSNLVGCVDEPNICRRSRLCGARTLWNKLSFVFKKELRSTSLQDLIKEQQRLFGKRKKAQMYYI